VQRRGCFRACGKDRVDLIGFELSSPRLPLPCRRPRYRVRIAASSIGRRSSARPARNVSPLRCGVVPWPTERAPACQYGYPIWPRRRRGVADTRGRIIGLCAAHPVFDDKTTGGDALFTHRATRRCSPRSTTGNQAMSTGRCRRRCRSRSVSERYRCSATLRRDRVGAGSRRPVLDVRTTARTCLVLDSPSSLGGRSGSPGRRAGHRGRASNSIRCRVARHHRGGGRPVPTPTRARPVTGIVEHDL